jgi:glycogen/starch/alpha-glucan phosphorylases
MFKDIDNFKQEYLDKFAELAGKPLADSTDLERYYTLVVLIKDKINLYGVRNQVPDHGPQKQVYYFSLEFLIGRLLSYYLLNLGVKSLVEQGLQELGIDLGQLVRQESDAGLGNGGLGRLAACYLDSMAFLGVPGHGNGIRYRYGLFQQKIVDGYQAEVSDNWLKNSYPWETKKPDKSVLVKFKGNVRTVYHDNQLTFIHENFEPVWAVPYDIPVIAYDNPDRVNNLRLWSAEPVQEEFDLACFNRGEYSQAFSHKAEVEAISNVLYPEDSSQIGKELRLRQEYFFTAAGLGSIVRRYKKRNESVHDFSRWVAVHINDTHPALCIPELMRILVDEEGLGWDEAWNITVNTISYTNHTIMPEALEKWPIEVFKYLLPRIYMIIEEIDRRFREELNRKYPGNPGLSQATAVLRDGCIHMADLAVIGSHSVNGVAHLHTEILKNSVLHDLYTIYPYKFNNKTNGVSYRRFLWEANPRLAALISAKIGDHWKKDAWELEKLLAYTEDKSYLAQLAEVKYQNKCRLSAYIDDTWGIKLDPASVFDIQVKRIHAYKRQLLNILKIMDLYNRLLENPDLAIRPYTFIFAGKAAPGYHYAKGIIKLVNTVAQKVNGDPEIRDKIKVVFLENFNVSLAEMIYPAADISEQISTASREASGTGNMKFMFNGAITLGTMDGANVEIRNAVGEENIVTFGLPAEKVMDYSSRGGYASWDVYHHIPRLRKVVDQLVNGFFEDSGGEFRSIYDSLLRGNDEFFVLKDFLAYTEAFNRISLFYNDQEKWRRSCLVNIARAGIFSSDRSVREYAQEIWKIPINSGTIKTTE